jgi:hypothetical protein
MFDSGPDSLTSSGRELDTSQQEVTQLGTAFQIKSYKSIVIQLLHCLLAARKKEVCSASDGCMRRILNFT